MDYRSRLGLLGNSPAASGSSDPGGRKARAVFRSSGLFFSCSLYFLSILTLFCLPYSSAPLTYFNLAVPRHKVFVSGRTLVHAFHIFYTSAYSTELTFIALTVYFGN